MSNNEASYVQDVTTDSAADPDSYIIETTLRDDEPVTGMAWAADRGIEADVDYLGIRQADDGRPRAGPHWVTAESIDIPPIPS